MAISVPLLCKFLNSHNRAFRGEKRADFNERLKNELRVYFYHERNA